MHWLATGKLKQYQNLLLSRRRFCRLYVQRPRSNLSHSLCPKARLTRWAWEFIMRASSYLARLYNHYNREFFGGRLPDGVKLYYASRLDKVNTKDGKHRSTCAVTYFYKEGPPKIVIRKTPASNMRHRASDLLHEMVHISKPNADCEAQGPNSVFRNVNHLVQ